MKLPRISYEELTKEKIEKEKIEMWGGEDDEILTALDIEDAIESILDCPPDSDFPGVVEVWGYKRRSVEDLSILDPDQLLEDILERLHEEYGSPLGDIPEPTEKMKKAATELSKAVAEDYQVWACDPVLIVEVDSMKWIKEHRPDWLEEWCTTGH